MKLLIHTCCAPCLIYPLEELRSNGHEIAGLFFNPNIHPFEEYNLRKAALEGLVRERGLQMDYLAYDPQEFLNAVGASLFKPERCCLCWRLRLKKTAQAALQRGFEGFSTTLLVSPYQDHALLKIIGEEVSKEEGITFYYWDFRPGFRLAQDEARAKGIYRQKYCGCAYSKKERSNRIK